MRPEAVMFALLNASSAITALVGARISESRMVENDPYPALVLDLVSGNLIHPINAAQGPHLVQARVQVTALGKTVGDVKTLLEQVRLACEFQRGAIAGVTVVSIVRDLIGPDAKNDELGVYYQPHDYMVTFYET
jgi:Protein of unknown function (DUF3168)